jgi:Flp pilus assembly protein TadD
LAFSAELSKLVDGEVVSRVAALNDAITREPTPKNLNGRGVVYARFGRYELAEKDFLAALNAKGDYVYALLNLGNIAMLKSDPTTAYDYYGRAARAAPDNSRALLELAGAAVALGKRDEADTAYVNAKKLDPQLAAQYQAPGQEAQGGTRAAEAGQRSTMWVEE